MERGLKQEQKRTNRIITHRHVARIAPPNFSIVTERFGVQLVPFSAATVNTEIEEEHESFLDVCPHFISGTALKKNGTTLLLCSCLCVCERELDTYREPYMI